MRRKRRRSPLRRDRANVPQVVQRAVLARQYKCGRGAHIPANLRRAARDRGAGLAQTLERVSCAAQTLADPGVPFAVAVAGGAFGIERAADGVPFAADGNELVAELRRVRLGLAVLALPDQVVVLEQDLADGVADAGAPVSSCFPRRRRARCGPKGKTTGPAQSSENRDTAIADHGGLRRNPEPDPLARTSSSSTATTTAISSGCARTPPAMSSISAVLGVRRTSCCIGPRAAGYQDRCGRAATRSGGT